MTPMSLRYSRPPPNAKTAQATEHIKLVRRSRIGMSRSKRSAPALKVSIFGIYPNSDAQCHITLAV